MNKLNFLVLLAGLSFSFGASAAAKYIFGGDGQTKFLAVGRPSALKIRGEGPGPVGELSAAPTGLAGSIEVDLSALKTGIDMRDEHMKEKYLLTKEHPKATLALTGLAEPTVPVKDAAFTGELEIKGVKKPVQGTYDFESVSGKNTLKARFKIKLTDFAVEIPKYAGISVADTVDVEIESPITTVVVAGPTKPTKKN